MSRPPGIRMRNPPPEKPGGSRGQRGAPPGAPNDGPKRKDSLWRRATGRTQLEAAMRERYRPYSFESNSTTLKWVTAALAVWVVAALALAWSDRQTQRLVSRLADEQNVVTLPPSDPRDFTSILEFAAREGIPCTSELEIASLTPDCVRVLDASRQYGDQLIYGYLALAAIIGVMIFIAFQWSTMVHRASRNLPTLLASGQRIKGDSLVLWSVLAGAAMFVLAFAGIFSIVGALIGVVLIVWKVLPGFIELFKASDPDAGTGDDATWRDKGSVPQAVYVWIASVVLTFLFNPNTAGRFWLQFISSGDGNTIDHAITALRLHIVADLLLILPAALAIITLRELHRRQEARHALVGEITYTPPLPMDPLEELIQKEMKKKESRKRPEAPR